MKTNTPLAYVAMDFTKRDDMLRAADLIARIQGDFGLKINDDYITTYSPQKAIADLACFGKSIFVDYKLFKGATRMINQVKELSETGAVRFTNVHVLAGDLLRKVVDRTKESGIGILGITILTHMDEAYCQKFLCRSLSEAVRFLTETAYEYGCAGVVMPGTCLREVKDIPLIKVIPGVRPKWYQGKKANQQAQAVEPATVILNGGNSVVVGSPIWDTENPVDSLKRILEEMENAKARLI